MGPWGPRGPCCPGGPCGERNKIDLLESECRHEDILHQKKKKKTQRNTHWMRALGWQECPKLRESVRRRPMVDCFCNGPSIYDHYRGDMMKTSRQVITLNMTQALIPPHPPLLFSLINKKPQACDMWGPYSLSHSDGMWFDFSVQLKRVPSN